VSRAPEPIRVVADGLFGPFGLGAGGGRLYVAQLLTGEITQINPNTGGTSTVAQVDGAQGVDRVGQNLLVVSGEGDSPTAPGPALWSGPVGGELTQVADLLAFELRNNPDGQRQFRNGEPLDSLSNPFAVVAAPDPEFAYVADAGANAVLKVSSSGRVRRFFVPSVITTGECEGRENNDNRHRGCDPVPTGLAYSADGTKLYVSALAGEAEGEGRVYILDAVTGKKLDEVSGFSSPTGIAVARDGTYYVSELLENFNPGNPEDIGRIVRVAPNGTRTYAQVTQPLGLVITGGELYSTAWSVSFFFGPPDLGQVVEVRPSAFSSSPS